MGVLIKKTDISEILLFDEIKTIYNYKAKGGDMSLGFDELLKNAYKLKDEETARENEEIIQQEIAEAIAFISRLTDYDIERLYYQMCCIKFLSDIMPIDYDNFEKDFLQEDIEDTFNIQIESSVLDALIKSNSHKVIICYIKHTINQIKQELNDANNKNKVSTERNLSKLFRSLSNKR